MYVGLPAVGTAVGASDAVGEVESTKSVSEIYAPVSGSVVAVNEAVLTSPELLNQDPYGAGWLFEVEVADTEEYDGLLDAAAYRALIEG